jgi:hypothetical protein
MITDPWEMLNIQDAEIDKLRAENEALQSRIREAIEVYGGMEGIPLPVNACEAYLLRTLEQMMAALRDGQ